ncbi:DNA topoisomerase [Peptoniphilus equinus]|uniref:DNA topoisomerase n=1 Tax=Peptoniphilus equinus TaxID=3016343 RepID=A0ABY7QSM2_9FIRM|nr:DNA topoisomerase [Peptoniphilus equinus]WBW49466.1 DNA topoisomerase [Peptoniphilus equinus]
MKTLILAEKPSVARDIARVLGVTKEKKGYLENSTMIVTWALGHLVELAPPERYDERFKKWRKEDLPIIPQTMKLQVIPTAKSQFNIVKSQLKREDVTEVVIATDAGREGELVARLILKMAGVRKPLKRLWISSVTDKAIREGFAHLRDGTSTEGLYRAGMSRSVADWIVGINASRALTVHYGAGLNAGRVQTPTLNLVRERELAVANFQPQTSYSLTVASQLNFKEVPARVFATAHDAQKAKEALKGPLVIQDQVAKEKIHYPKPLYDLTHLQSEAYNAFGFSAKKTLGIMQALYEQHKILTYPRTDSQYLTEDIVPTLGERLKAINEPQYRQAILAIQRAGIHGTGRFVDDSKVSDHHAIIPTEKALHLDELSDDEYKIADMVITRFLSQLKPPVVELQYDITATLGGRTFKAVSSEMVKAGTLDYTVTVHEHTSKPPAYFTEGTLLLAMESPFKIGGLSDTDKAVLKETGGIGTVATRADIIDKLFKSGVIEAQHGAIRTTGKGRQLLELVPESLKSPKLTAKWEQELTAIERGELDAKIFDAQIIDSTKDNTEAIFKSNKVYRHENLTSTRCPVCGKLMVHIHNKDRDVLKCQDPECNGTQTLSVMTKSKCPECHKRLKLDMKSQMYVCDTCGYRISKAAMEKKFEQKRKQPKKQEVKKYLSNQNSDIGNSLGDLLKGLEL